MTNSTNHPWAKYYASRGVNRPPLAELAVRAARPSTSSNASTITTKKPVVLSPELTAAVTAIAATTDAGSSARFVSTERKEALARETSRIRRMRVALWAGICAAVAVLLHVGVTQVFYRAPAPKAVQAHAEQLKADLLPLYSTPRQPLQVDAVSITGPERIEGGKLRYFAHVTLRLRKPLYVPAASNGTAAYRQLQVSLQAARDQELRYNLFSEEDAPEAPSLPMLLQTSHRAGDTVVVKVPFSARRFGWEWKLEAPQLGARVANRMFDGNSLEFFADAPYLIYGPQALAEVRQKTKEAREYVVAVAKEVQRQAGGQAIAESVPTIAHAEASAEGATEHAPAIDPDAPAVNPDAPAVLLPEEATRPAFMAPPVARR